VVLCSVLASWAQATPSAAGFQCHSDVDLGNVTAAERKGFAVDDTTWRYCSSQIPVVWPNSLSGAPLTSLRLFKAWDTLWDEADREVAWQNLKAFVTATGAKVLLGTPITCHPESDDAAWAWSKQLLEVLGADHVMGLAIGNELELLFSKASFEDSVTPECIERLWEGGGIWRHFSRVVAEFDAMGFGSVPVTSVFGGLALAGTSEKPFYEKSGKALVNSFLENATRTYGNRYAWTWTTYPYFDPYEAMDANTDDECSSALLTSLCWDLTCDGPKTIAYTRKKMKKFTGRTNDTLWIGETGWSSPRPKSLTTEMKNCLAWSSNTSFEEFYRHFLDWDLSVPGQEPADHVFYFTLRDSLNFGASEHFGVVEHCDASTCKLRSEGYTAPTTTRTTTVFDWGIPTSTAFKPVLTSLVVVLIGSALWAARF